MCTRKVAETKQEIIKRLMAAFEWIGKDNDGLTLGKERKKDAYFVKTYRYFSESAARWRYLQQSEILLLISQLQLFNSPILYM